MDQATRLAVLKAIPSGYLADWQDVGHRRLDYLWGTGSGPPGELERELVNNIVSLGHTVFREHPSALRDFVYGGFAAGSPFAYWRRNADECFRELVAKLQRLDLAPAVDAFTTAVLGAYLTEAIVQSQLAFLVGLLRLRAGHQVLPSDVRVASRDGRLKDIATTITHLAREGKSANQAWIVDLVRGVSGNLKGPDRLDIGFVDFRHMVSHHDFDVTPQGDLIGKFHARTEPGNPFVMIRRTNLSAGFRQHLGLHCALHAGIDIVCLFADVDEDGQLFWMAAESYLDAED